MEHCDAHALAIGSSTRRHIMFGWAVTFLVIALVAALLGFGGLAGTATNIAYIVFVVALILAVIGFFRGRSV
jgi:uncharacterized membrane protein YtjA (UPF0391 family)